MRVVARADRAEPWPTQLTLTVVAVPGDRIRSDGPAMYVNDQVVVGFSPEFIRRVNNRPGLLLTVVPDGHYFVMAEQRSNTGISEYWASTRG